MNNKRIGNIGEVKALSKFIELGVPVYLPFGDNETADLIADFNGKLNKIQVKTSIKAEDGKMTFQVCSAQSSTRKNIPSARYIYTKNEVDYFVLYNIERDELLLVPFEVIEGKIEITIRYELPKNNQKIGIHMNSDFTFETYI